MKIVIGIPTGGRAEQSVEVARSWIKKGIRVFILTWDEKTEEAFLAAKLEDVEVMLVESMLSFAANQNMMMAMNDWDVWVCGADDLWSGGQPDLADRIELIAGEAGNRLIWVADGCLNQQPTHPIITRAMYKAEGPKILCEEYKHNFVDTDLFARMLKKNKVIKCYDIVLDHRHHLQNRADKDEIYRIGDASYPEDAIIFHKKMELWGQINTNSAEVFEIEEAKA